MSIGVVCRLQVKASYWHAIQLAIDIHDTYQAITITSETYDTAYIAGRTRTHNHFTSNIEAEY